MALLATVAAAPRASETFANTPPGAVSVSMDTAEADAVLAILAKERAGEEVAAFDWKRLFETTGYQRLAARETAMKRPFTKEEFQSFVRSPALVSEREALLATLARWKRVDVAAAAARALAYLPDGARIEATVFPVIKPKPNSFVFSEPEPSIFLAVDPAVTTDKLANTLAHELHHIGFGSACPPLAVRAETEALPQPKQDALKWLSAFGEGFAMLAAAGGSGVHPHAASPAEDRTRWDRDMANVDRDLGILDQFFRDILEGRLTGEQANERGFSFFGVQGPWYTVGYQIAVTIERASGRDEMIRCFCDVRRLLNAYNEAAEKLGRRGARWSRPLTDALAAPAKENLPRPDPPGVARLPIRLLDPAS